MCSNICSTVLRLLFHNLRSHEIVKQDIEKTKFEGGKFEGGKSLDHPAISIPKPAVVQLTPHSLYKADELNAFIFSEIFMGIKPLL